MSIHAGPRTLGGRTPRHPPAVGDAAPPPLLPTVSIVEQTMGQARRSVALALAGAALITGGLLAERLWFSAAHDGAAQRHARAVALLGTLRLADAHLTSTAQLAVVTGERRWVEEYDEHLNQLDRALSEARALAPAVVARRFEGQTRTARDELDNLRESAFEAVAVGAPEAARAIFDSKRYRQAVAQLAGVTDEFTTATVAATRTELTALKQRALVMGVLVLVGARWCSDRCCGGAWPTASRSRAASSSRPKTASSASHRATCSPAWPTGLRCTMRWPRRWPAPSATGTGWRC